MLLVGVLDLWRDFKPDPFGEGSIIGQRINIRQAIELRIDRAQQIQRNLIRVDVLDNFANP